MASIDHGKKINKFNKKDSKIEITDGVLIPGRGSPSVFSAWRIAFFGAIIIFITLPIISPDPFAEIIKFVVPMGLLDTFLLTVSSIIIALAIGLVAGLGRISRVTILNRISTVYVEVIRGIPLLVQIFYIYFGLTKYVLVPRFPAAVIAMAICYGAYMGEIFRAGILAIPKGQMEAAIALGMSRRQALRWVIIPQTLKVILPPIGNEFIALLKDSSLVSVVAIVDLLRAGRMYASRTFEYFEVYTIIALIYLIITLFLSKLVGIMEEKFAENER